MADVATNVRTMTEKEMTKPVLMMTSRDTLVQFWSGSPSALICNVTRQMQIVSDFRSYAGSIWRRAPPCFSGLPGNRPEDQAAFPPRNRESPGRSRDSYQWHGTSDDCLEAAGG